MTTNTEWLRQRIEERAFGRKVPPLEELRKSEWSTEFEILMRNRLMMGAFRYGWPNVGVEKAYRRLASMRQRLEVYESTGNLELLVDVANLCLLEYLNPTVSNAALMPIDDGEHVERG